MNISYFATITSFLFLSLTSCLEPPSTRIEAGEQALAGETSAGEMSAGEMSAGETSAGEMSAGEMSAGETSAGETSAGEMSAGETSAGETSAGEMSAGEMSAGETSAGEMSAGETSAGETSAGEMSAGESGPAPCLPESCPDIEWITINRGYFDFSNIQVSTNYSVSLPSFDISKSEITIGQYRACVDDFNNPQACNTEGMNQSECSWTDQPIGKEDHPINCLSRGQAFTYAMWTGRRESRVVRLPSETEWEYVARSQGLSRYHPWGEIFGQACDVIHHRSCGEGAIPINIPSSVCTHPESHSEQGVCDLISNLAEWVMDEWEQTPQAPEDGKPNCHRQCSSIEIGVIRGGSWIDMLEDLNVLARSPINIDSHRVTVGARLLRERPPVTQDPPPRTPEWLTLESGEIDPDQEGPIPAVMIEAFQIMKHEITLGQYRACVAADVCAPPNGDCTVNSNLWGNWTSTPENREEHPITGVTQQELEIYAGWVGQRARLPTINEWLYTVTQRASNLFIRSTCQQGNTSSCMGRGMTMGICLLDELSDTQRPCDLLGNVAEFVINEERGGHQYIGGSWNQNIDTIRPFTSQTLSEGRCLRSVGGRLVRPMGADD